MSVIYEALCFWIDVYLCADSCAQGHRTEDAQKKLLHDVVSEAKLAATLNSDDGGDRRCCVAAIKYSLFYADSHKDCRGHITLAT